MKSGLSEDVERVLAGAPSPVVLIGGRAVGHHAARLAPTCTYLDAFVAGILPGDEPRPSARETVDIDLAVETPAALIAGFEAAGFTRPGRPPARVVRGTDCVDVLTHADPLKLPMGRPDASVVPLLPGDTLAAAGPLRVAGLRSLAMQKAVAYFDRDSMAEAERDLLDFGTLSLLAAAEPPAPIGRGLGREVERSLRRIERRFITPGARGPVVFAKFVREAHGGDRELEEALRMRCAGAAVAWVGHLLAG